LTRSPPQSSPEGEAYKYVLEREPERGAASEVVRARGAATKARQSGICACWILDKSGSAHRSGFSDEAVITSRCATACSTRTSTRRRRTNRQLEYCSDAIEGFFREMTASGRADDVVMYVHSEFGRRVPEKPASHRPTAQVNFVIGNAVKGGCTARRKPSNLVLGDNLENTTDFRDVYATLINGGSVWTAAKVLGRHSPQLDLFRAVSEGERGGHSHQAGPLPARVLEGRPHANQRGRLDLRSRCASPESCGIRRIPRNHSEAADAGSTRGNARSCTTRASRTHACSVRRIGSLDPALNGFPKVVPRRPTAPSGNGVSMGIDAKPSAASAAADLRSLLFYWLRRRCSKRGAGVLVGNRMLQTSHPVEQKMALLWHGHFATHETRCATTARDDAADRSLPSGTRPATS